MLSSASKSLIAAATALALCIVALPAPAQGQAPSFDDLARRAEAALDSRPAEAAALYRQALALRPDWAEGWLYLGATLYQTGRYAEATHAFRKGITLAPAQGTAWAFLGMCEAELDNPEQALADISKGLELGLGDNWPFQVAVRIKAAQIHIQASAFDQALLHLQPLSLKNENAPAVVETMGLTALGLAAVPSQLPEARRAVVRSAGRAAWALANQHPAEAAAAYRELIEQYPNEPGVHYAHGLYLMESDMSGALAEFQKEVQVNPNHWPALIVMGGLQVRQGAAESAVQTLNRAMKLAPATQRWIIHGDLGRAKMTGDDLPGAVAEFETAVRLMPVNAQLRFLLSQAYRRAGRAADADKQKAEFEKLKALEDPLGVPGFRPSTTAGM